MLRRDLFPYTLRHVEGFAFVPSERFKGLKAERRDVSREKMTNDARDSNEGSVLIVSHLLA